MKITVNREPPALPPVTSITVEFSVDQLRFIKYLAFTTDVTAAPAGLELYNKLNTFSDLDIPVNWDVTF